MTRACLPLFSLLAFYNRIFVMTLKFHRKKIWRASVSWCNLPMIRKYFVTFSPGSFFSAVFVLNFYLIFILFLHSTHVRLDTALSLIIFLTLYKKFKLE